MAEHSEEILRKEMEGDDSDQKFIMVQVSSDIVKVIKAEIEQLVSLRYTH